MVLTKKNLTGIGGVVCLCVKSIQKHEESTERQFGYFTGCHGHRVMYWCPINAFNFPPYLYKKEDSYWLSFGPPPACFPPVSRATMSGCRKRANHVRAKHLSFSLSPLSPILSPSMCVCIKASLTTLLTSLLVLHRTEERTDARQSRVGTRSKEIPV